MNRAWGSEFILPLSLLLLSFDRGATAERRHGQVHVHGVASVNFAVEGTKAVVEFRAPAEDVIGFEHQAKSESDKKKRDAALIRLRERGDHMFVFDSRLGCRSDETTSARSPIRAKLTSAARHFLDLPYRWGGMSERGGMDCSGLIKELFAKLDIDLPRTSREQFGSGENVPVENLQTGDLLFFHPTA